VNFSGLDVLVVDDDVMLRRRMVSVLERLEAEATAAEKLQAATTFIAATSFAFARLGLRTGRHGRPTNWRQRKNRWWTN
jgi:hypothetical protein